MAHKPTWWQRWLLRWIAGGRPVLLNMEIQYKGVIRFPAGAYIDDSRAILITEEHQRNGRGRHTCVVSAVN